MKVKALQPCFVDNAYHEAGEVFEWRNVRRDPLPACMESMEPETPSAVQPEPVGQPPAKRRPGRPKKQK